MTVNEIKKELYKQKDLLAKFVSATKSGLLYGTRVQNLDIYFLVPFEEVGDATFEDYIKGSLLIRYLINKE